MNATANLFEDAQVIPLPRQGGRLTRFDPLRVKVSQAKAAAIIAYARSIRDWPSLENAVDCKIDEQVQFVSWWQQNVRRRGERSNLTDHVRFLSQDAEEQTGITQKQVSRWRKRLADKDQYRAQLILAGYRKADLAPEFSHRTQCAQENEPEIVASKKLMAALQRHRTNSLPGHLDAGQDLPVRQQARRCARPCEVPLSGSAPSTAPLISLALSTLVMASISGRHANRRQADHSAVGSTVTPPQRSEG